MPAPTTDSFMYQTMHRQPADVERLLESGWEPAEQAARLLAPARRIYVAGIGTSYHAALAGAWLLRAAGSDARAVSSFDFAVYPESYPLMSHDAVIVMAHSGVKEYSSRSLARAAEAGVTRISVGSLTADHPGSQLVLRTVERERSAAFTSSHVAAMTVLAQIATALGEGRAAPGIAGFRHALEQLPNQIVDVLDRKASIEPIARAAAGSRVYAAGAGPNEVTAIEAVIKVREAAQGWIDALALEQFLHGPIVAVNAGDRAIVVNMGGLGQERTEQVARVLEAMGADIWLVGRAIEGLNGEHFALPEPPEAISPLLAVIPVQLFAYFMAVEKGINPDKFRRDEDRYNAAFGLIKL